MKKIITIAILSVITFSSCKKVPGPKGDSGIDGKNGTSNIISNQFTVNTPDWIQGCSNTCFLYRSSYNITQKILDQGSFEAYFQSGTEWVKMPVVIGDVEYYFTNDILEFNIKVRSASGTVSIPNPGQLIYRTVVIPPIQ